MKRFYFLAASIGLLAACSGLEQPEQDFFINDGKNLVEKVVFEVLPIKDGDDLETRASAVPNGGAVNFAWEVTDTVGIFPDKGSQVFFSMESGAGTSSASFDGGGWALKQGTSYISYYPLVGEFYLDRTKIPASFAGQKQVGIESPFNGARYFLATEPTSSENGVLRFSYKTLNTIINVNATLPAGTYTKASLTVSEPLFVEEGTYSLNEQTIVGKTYSNTLKIDLEDVTLTKQGVLPIYFMSAPVDLKGKEVTVKVISSDGKKYECVKTPSKSYAAGTRYGLTCDNMEQSNAGDIVFADANIKAALVAAFDTEGDGELSYMEAAAVTSIEGVFGTKKTYTSFDEFQYFTGVKTIPSSMFEGWQISSIVLPESLTDTGYYAFKNCLKLTSVTVLGINVFFSEGSFYGCSRLSNICITGSVKAIGRYSFQGCSSLTSITIPGSVLYIGDSAFKDCYSLDSISLLESLGNIYASAFQNCSSLTNITIPESVWAIGQSAFCGCSSLTSIILPDSLSSIGKDAFSDCSSLTSIIIPGLVTSIGSSAFQNCTSLTSVTLPESLTSIGDSAFKNCNSLTSISIPHDLYKIEESTFDGCSSLTSISIPESVMSIGRFAFRDCSNLTSISIPESVSDIGDLAFRNCSSLRNVTIPESVTNIGASTFAFCSSLMSMTIPESVTSIGYEAFRDCSSLTSIIIPESVTSIEDGAFAFCSSLTNITIPQSVTSIRHSTFYGCSSLTTVIIPESVTSIEGGVFDSCTSLTNVIIPESVTSIGGYAFQNCTSLTNITIPQSVTSIGDYAFYYCQSLTSIVCLAQTPPSGVSSSTFGSTNGCGIYVPTGYVDTYKAANGWSFYSDRIYSMEGGYVPPSGDGGND